MFCFWTSLGLIFPFGKPAAKMQKLYFSRVYVRKNKKRKGQNDEVVERERGEQIVWGILLYGDRVGRERVWWENHFSVRGREISILWRSIALWAVGIVHSSAFFLLYLKLYVGYFPLSIHFIFICYSVNLVCITFQAQVSIFYV